MKDPREEAHRALATMFAAHGEDTVLEVLATVLEGMAGSAGSRMQERMIYGAASAADDIRGELAAVRKLNPELPTLAAEFARGLKDTPDTF